MTSNRTKLFALSATTAFFSAVQISLSKEITRAKKDKANKIKRQQLQVSAERLLKEKEESTNGG